MACRLPGAEDAPAFWRNLVDGVESVRFYTRQEQEALGVPDDLLDDPTFVPAAAIAADYGALDAAFFGMSPREAELRDPQQRMFLELANTALEDAGYDPARYDGEIGVYGGDRLGRIPWMYIRPNKKVFAAVGNLAIYTGNDTDYLATRVSYKLDLRGPSVTVQTACSTSLVAVHLACQACAPASATWRWPAACPWSCPPNGATCTTRTASSPPTGTAAPSTPPRPARSGAAAAGWSCSSGWPTPSPTATTSTPW